MGDGRRVEGLDRGKGVEEVRQKAEMSVNHEPLQNGELHSHCLPMLYRAWLRC